MTEIKMGRFRSMFFPIYANELKKLLPLTLIFLFVSFNYALLRGLKDVYVYNKMSKESIYILKVLVIPSIIIFTILYTFIAKRVSRDVRFNIVVTYFFLFFSFFYLFSDNESIQLTKISEVGNSFFNYPALWKCIRFWLFSLFYIHAEAWGTIVLGVAFWTFANEIVSSLQAKRIYPFLTVGAALGSVFSGVFMFFSPDIDLKGLPIIGNITVQSLQIWVVLILILLILSIYNSLSYNINKNPEGYGIENKIKKNKVKLSFAQSMAVLLKSKYLLLLACIVFGYNMFIVFLESVWKGRVGSYESELVQNFIKGDMTLWSAGKTYARNIITKLYGVQSILVGVLSLFWIFFVSRIITKKKWSNVAVFTPIVGFICSVVFLLLFVFQNSLGFFVKNYNFSFLFLLVVFGLGILCFIKSSKYVFFDTSKERAYIPLDEESKVNGKAAIDAMGSRLAKGSSAVLISVLVYIFNGLDNIIYITFFLVFLLLAVWLFAVYKLEPLYEQKLKESNRETK